MITWKWLKGELAVSAHLVSRGDEERALEHLSALFAQYDPNDELFDLHRATILHAMGKAATSLKDLETADRCYVRAVEILRCSQPLPAAEQADFNMSLAEHFIAHGRIAEAAHFADQALECVILEGAVIEKEESAELLRRYAWVAEKSGSFPTAYLALSLGMLILHQINGMESDIAESLAALADRVCDSSSPRAVHRVGKYVAQNLKRGGGCKDILAEAG